MSTRSFSKVSFLTHFCSYAIPELVKTKGTIIASSSASAQIRLRFQSEYGISKFALNRLIEFTVLGQLLVVSEL